MRRLAEKYEQPLFLLERMPIGAFYREIAILLGESITREAARLQARTGDKKERRRLDKEWSDLKKSTDWLDRMIREKIESK